MWQVFSLTQRMEIPTNHEALQSVTDHLNLTAHINLINFAPTNHIVS